LGRAVVPTGAGCGFAATGLRAALFRRAGLVAAGVFGRGLGAAGRAARCAGLSAFFGAALGLGPADRTGFFPAVATRAGVRAGFPGVAFGLGDGLAVFFNAFALAVPAGFAGGFFPPGAGRPVRLFCLAAAGFLFFTGCFFIKESVRV
jgi:hypothetical protein